MSAFGGFGSGGSGFGSTNNNNTTTGFGGFGSNNTSNTGFGTGNNAGGFGASNTGGGLFGSGNTSSGFGGNTGGFGASSNTGGFGQKPAFGGTSTSGGLFGGSTTTTSGGGFGGFGSNNNASTSSPFGGGGGTGGSIFGSNANKPTFGATNTGSTGGGGLFGSGNTTSNTATSTGFGGFGNTSNAPASTALGPVGDPPGTANVTNFAPLVEKENTTSSAQNSYQNILFQDPYKKWSAEELRLADYAAGRRFGGTSGTGTFGVGSGFGSGFGSNTQTSGSFGNTNTTTNTGGGLFGNTSSSGGVFGQNNNTATTGFGSNTSGTGGMFGNKPAATGGLFGSSATTQPAQSGGLFGSGSTGFGNTGNTGTGFGSTNTNTGSSLFGAANNTNQPKPAGFSFNNTNNNAGSSGFGTNAGGFGSGTANTGGGGLFGSNTNTNQSSGGGLFGNATPQNTGSVFGGGSGGFGNQNQQQTGSSLFNNNQQKPAGTGIFGSSTNTSGTGGGLFGGSTNTSNTFGQPANNQTGGGLFGNKPATGTGGGLFGNTGATQNTNTGGSGLFGGLGQNNQQQQQPQQGSSLFGSLGQNQQKPSMFGSTTQSTGGGLFGNQNNQQQGSSLFGTSSAQQQPQNNNMGGSMFGSPQANQSTASFTASINDPSAYGSLFASIGNNEVSDPGPLATPTNKKQSRRPSILPYYKLNPASASRFVTPQKRGFGFSYSTYGTPNSPSSVASTPGTMSQSLLGGSLTRSVGNSLAKSVSTSNLRRSFNVEDSLLAPGAFSAGSGSRLYGGGSVKKLVINKDLRSDLFSTPTKDKSVPETPNSSRKLTKRVSFDTSNVDAVEDGATTNGSTNSTPSAEQLGYVRPKATNGVNGSKSTSIPEMEQVKGNELAVVHEEEAPSPQGRSSTTALSDGEPGEYWMSPTKEEIQGLNRVQRQKVSDFTVGRENVGYVKFKVPVDLTSVDVDNIFHNIVILEPRSATVYPNAAKKPPVGKGLNVPAIINLENSWPRASKKGKPISILKHVERLKRIPDTKLENYNEQTGEWTFSVEHFTTYGLDESDDDEDTETRPSEAPSAYALEKRVSPSPSSASEDVASDVGDTLDGKRSYPILPGAFDPRDDSCDEEAEMTEVAGSRPSFLANRSAGSKSNALVPIEQDESDDEYAMSEVHEDTSTSLGQHLAAEQEDNSFDGSQFDTVPETPAGIMRARMRAIKGSATPMKVQVSSGDDWMDMLSKTISPQKRDRALLRTINEADQQRAANGNSREASPTKKRIVPDGRGFATSIDLMNSLFEKARTPTENLQASVRPKGVKWPYKRQTKHLDESDMDEQDRIWHDTMRPRWGPNGTLVFSATPSGSAFGRSSRITDKNALMTVLKGGIVSETQDIRIAKFTNEMSARAVHVHSKLAQIELINGVPSVRLSPRATLKDFSVGTNGKNVAEEHERLVWELASVLFDSIKIPVDLQNDAEAVEKLRRENLSRFWERMVEEQTSKTAAMAGSSEEKALASLSGHRIAEACKHLLDGKNFRLATLVSLIGTNDAVKKDVREQMKEWHEAHVLSEFSQSIRALYEMLSGNVCACEGTKGALENRTESFLISKRFGLNWQQAFGLRLWYAISSEDRIADAVEKYREDVEQDRELAPVTWFTEHGIKSIWNDPNQDQREDLLWGLLQLYSNSQVDLEAILRPENSQLSPLDFRLSWQLGQALTSTGRASFGKNAAEKADAATVSFAAQLTNEGSWLEATFVLLHLADPDARSKAIQDHLCRHAGFIGNEDSSNFKRLTAEFKIPRRWIWHAKALYMRSVKKDPAAEVQCLLRAESWADAHRTFIKEVAPVTIIERDYDALADLLHQFEGHHSQVPDWNVGGEIYKAFLQLMGCQRRAEFPPPILVNALLEGLPAMHGNTPEAGITEYAALTDMAAEVAKVVANMAKAGEMEHERVLHLPLTEDVLLKHSRDFAWSHYSTVMAGF
ncbi:nuclear protein 96-domain-containing protein [Annulohypoxylon truncatum]|uniref:nuclear protein 96-domain-containing protein n=1 Tax=Annulohypoxylon truncatum TaxID=327061 RepID=UPI0020075D36|nr:nuclear protein 96-domain-containing protein [Annulohypoxylon truncatum]KAI1205023.1 nuclear protein 96-domain-containing protein [Annulohypoxylon truncatum]